MEPDVKAFLTSRRSLVLVLALLVAAVASATGPVSAGPASVDAAMPATKRRADVPPRYTFETLYELRPGASEPFDRYWAALVDVSRRTRLRTTRYVDGTPGGSDRLVTLPVVHLKEFGVERLEQDALVTMLGVEPAAALLSAFDSSQELRTAYIRHYRPELGLNPARYQRTAASELTFVTVVAGRESRFEQLWRRALDAYRRLRPDDVRVVARTVVGGGPQFVLTQPLPSLDAPGLPMPADAVRQAFGERSARSFERALSEVVLEWQTRRYSNLGYDTVARSVDAR